MVNFKNIKTPVLSNRWAKYLIEVVMQKFLVPFATFFVISCAPELSADPNIELVRDEYEAYFNDFVARDFDAIASHFQFPTMNRLTTPAVVLSTQDEVSAFFESLPIQDGYSYSLMDRIDIYRLAEIVYYVDLDFTRYNTSDENLFEGRTLYFFGNETGSWKVFAQVPVQRDD